MYYLLFEDSSKNTPRSTYWPCRIERARSLLSVEILPCEFPKDFGEDQRIDKRLDDVPEGSKNRLLVESNKIPLNKHIKSDHVSSIDPQDEY